MKPGPKSVGRGGARKNAGRPTLDPNGIKRTEKITSLTPREKAWLLERLKEYRAASGETEDW